MVDEEKTNENKQQLPVKLCTIGLPVSTKIPRIHDTNIDDVTTTDVMKTCTLTDGSIIRHILLLDGQSTRISKVTLSLQCPGRSE
jgi:hypothetical protein